MNGHVVPPEIMVLEPWYLNFIDNMATVQFDHRAIAWALAVTVPLFWWRVRSTSVAPAASRRGAALLLGVLIVQAALGISTLLLGVPLPLAIAHQAGAVLVFAAVINAAHALR
jgi:cytochrome c oxidase assembly protein subunit 15